VVIARLRADATLSDSRVEMKGIARRLEQAYPRSNADSSVELRSALDALVGDARNVLLVLLGAVGLILLIACANVASLLLARASTRQRELAIRASLGASVRVLVQQQRVESVVLSLFGVAGGIALAFLITRTAPAVAPDLPRVNQSTVDARVLGFALLAAVINALVFGFAPVLQVLNARLDPWLRERSFGGRGRRTRSAVVAAEIALSLMLLVAAGVLVRSLQNVSMRQRGLDPNRVLTFDVRLPESTYAEGEPVRNFYALLEERIATVPGVRSVGAISVLPYSGSGNQSRMTIPGGDPQQGVRTDVNAVTPEYFRTMSISLLRGRNFRLSDHADAPAVAIVDESFARRFWPNEDPIGKRVEGWGFHALTVVGVVRHVPNYGVTEESREELYVPHAQRAYLRMNVVVRTSGDPLAVTPTAAHTRRARSEPAILQRAPHGNRGWPDGRDAARSGVISNVFALIAVLRP
jgi:putative ABC transport system permease protein